MAVCNTLGARPLGLGFEPRHPYRRCAGRKAPSLLGALALHSRAPTTGGAGARPGPAHLITRPGRLCRTRSSTIAPRRGYHHRQGTCQDPGAGPAPDEARTGRRTAANWPPPGPTDSVQCDPARPGPAVCGPAAAGQFVSRPGSGILREAGAVVCQPGSASGIPSPPVCRVGDAAGAAAVKSCPSPTRRQRFSRFLQLRRPSFSVSDDQAP